MMSEVRVGSEDRSCHYRLRHSLGLVHDPRRSLGPDNFGSFSISRIRIQGGKGNIEEIVEVGLRGGVCGRKVWDLIGLACHSVD